MIRRVGRFSVSCIGVVLIVCVPMKHETVGSNANRSVMFCEWHIKSVMKLCEITD